MKLRARKPRYSDAVLFSAGLAGSVLLAAVMFQGFAPSLDIWLAAALVVTLLLYTHLGLRLTRAEQEISMLRRLSDRVIAEPSELTSASLSPSITADGVVNLSLSEQQILGRLRDAVAADRVDLYLQPIVSLPQRKTRFFEAFSRLRDVDGKVIRPRDYLEAAERANRIGIIDNLILLRCVQALRQLDAKDSRFVVFCNVSPATLCDAEFFAQFTDYLESNADLAPHLVFEFTWPALQIMHPKVEDTLAILGRQGFSFSVDHIHSLEFDWQSLREKNFRFVKAPSRLLSASAHIAPDAAARLKRFRENLAAAEIDLIAEKIENESDMPEILQLGIDYGQGNLFGPPRRAEFYLNSATHEQPAPLPRAS